MFPSTEVWECAIDYGSWILAPALPRMNCVSLSLSLSLPFLVRLIFIIPRNMYVSWVSEDFKKNETNRIGKGFFITVVVVDSGHPAASRTKEIMTVYDKKPPSAVPLPHKRERGLFCRVPVGARTDAIA